MFLPFQLSLLIASKSDLKNTVVLQDNLKHTSNMMPI